MKTLAVLALLVAVAVANPLVNIRVNVDNQNGASDDGTGGAYPDNPEVPPGGGDGPSPFQPMPYNVERPDMPGAPAARGTLVNIEVFIDNESQGKGVYDPEPYHVAL